MKRAERHHLKENELEHWTREVRDAVTNRPRALVLILAIAIVVGGGLLGYVTWRSRVQARAERVVADAMAVEQAGIVSAPGSVAPAGTFATERARAEAALAKYQAAADAYPATDAGIFARYQQASLLMTLNKPGEAVACYQDVISRSGEKLYGQMARLGLALAQSRAGQIDQAINAFKELAQRKEGALPVDGVLIQLGRAYLDAGKPADAQQAFKRLVDEYPNSPFAVEAQQRLENLSPKKG